MRTHTTLTLRKLILHEMDAEKNQMTQQEIRVWIETLPDVAAEMFKCMDFFIGSIFDRGMVGRQVRQIQSECIYLLNAIDKYENLGAGLEKLKKEVIKCLDLILERVNTHGGKYLEEKTLMPRLHFKREQSGLEAQVSLLISRMRTAGVEKVLQEIIMECFESFKKARQCTYYKMNYIKDLLEALVQITGKDNKSLINGNLSHHLFEANYNTEAYMKYSQKKIREEMNEIYEVKEQFNRLYFYQAEFKNRPYRKSRERYDLNRRRNKEIMTDFINAELSCLQQQHRPEPVLQPAQPLGGNGSANHAGDIAGYKIRFLLSVDALAFFIKLLVQAKVIDGGVRTELLAFVAKVFITPGVSAAGISPGSLGVKYKQVVQSTAMNVRAALARMVKIIDDEFGRV
ncbi:MAG TPA: hypothetical protein VK541_15510 [Pedobacter sp.]|uniref:hypothetical protein n=1 Tax=Pedobacter sp. TaxID=1411316 RepID=UPI002B86A8CA|nr:hypothetical protein [Pedobacter sp.]HMI03892.1 hypothetical protein [Pedobacter sp.]